jgi:hypothetical protein
MMNLRECGRAANSNLQLNAAAKCSYRARLQDLCEQLKEAQRFNDSHRTSVIEKEIRFLAIELASAVGLKSPHRKVLRL